MNMDEILQMVALKNGVSVEEVREEIQKSIKDAASHPSPAFKKAFGDKEPSVEDFLRVVSSEAMKRTEN